MLQMYSWFYIYCISYGLIVYFNILVALVISERSPQYQFNQSYRTFYTVLDVIVPIRSPINEEQKQSLSIAQEKNRCDCCVFRYLID